jgi:hypothetical protein
MGLRIGHSKEQSGFYDLGMSGKNMLDGCQTPSRMPFLSRNSTEKIEKLQWIFVKSKKDSFQSEVEHLQRP